MPRVVREIIGCPLPWQASGSAERVFSQSFDVGTGEVEQFIELIASPLRKLPLIVVSDLGGRPIAGNLHAKLATDLCGLGHVCRLKSEAALEVTEQLGREWSCYNGAVRLFWPFTANRDNPRNHPLWTFDYLTRRGDSEDVVRDRIRHHLRQRLLEASTFVADDPAFARFASTRLKSLQPKPHAESGISERLAQAQAQIDELNRAVEDRDGQIAALNDELTTLYTKAFSQEAASEVASTSPTAPPKTVSEAVEMAKTAHSDVLAFPDRLDEQIQSLNASAGPPEKVLRYLEDLAALSRALASGNSIGKSIPKWLADRNVRCSEESETKANNKAAHRRRTFQIGGRAVHCEFHAKPNDSVPPDQCVRIYFSPSTTSPHIQVGYVGRHFD